MSWEQRCLLERLVEFLERALSGGESISELCSKFSISRSCRYKWLNLLHRAGGISSLKDRSRRPHKTGKNIFERFRDSYN